MTRSARAVPLLLHSARPTASRRPCPWICSGSVSVTASGGACSQWSTVPDVDFSWVSDTHNFCRSNLPAPDGKEGTPWCFTGALQPEECSVCALLDLEGEFRGGRVIK